MKRVLSLITVMALPITWSARDAVGQAGRVSVGAKAGANFADVSTAFESATTRSGLVIGGMMAFAAHSGFVLQAEVLFSQRGQDTLVASLAQDPTTGVWVESSRDLVMDYLEVPILGRVVVPTGIVLHPTLYVGPSIAFELACSFATLTRFFAPTGQFLGDEREEGIECVDQRGVDVGLVLGGGVEIDTGAAVVTLEGRYQNGFVDVFQGGSLKHRVFSVMGGVAVRLGR